MNILCFVENQQNWRFIKIRLGQVERSQSPFWIVRVAGVVRGIELEYLNPQVPGEHSRELGLASSCISVDQHVDPGFFHGHRIFQIGH